MTETPINIPKFNLRLVSIKVIDGFPVADDLRRIYTKACRYKADALIWEKPGFLHLFVPFAKSVIRDTAKKFGDEFFAALNAENITHSDFLKDDPANNFYPIVEIFDRSPLNLYDLSRAVMTPHDPNEPPTPDGGNGMFVSDEDFKAAKSFISGLARKLNKIPELEEVYDAWKKDKLMAEHLGDPETFPVPRILKFVASGFRPKSRSTASDDPFTF